MASVKNSQFKWPVIGHSNIVNYLQKSLYNLNFNHAYLFSGPSNIGKTLVAQYFADSLICDNLGKSSGNIPCFECRPCKQAINKIHPDVFWLKRVNDEKTGKLKKNISIGQIRELQAKLSLHSFMDSHKVAVIMESEKLSQEAANSLLKTLEEPTKKTVIILVTSKINSLPKTILSRCQILNFLPASKKEIFDYLIDQKLERKKAKLISEISGGKPGLAIEYFKDDEIYLEFQDQSKQFIFLLKNNNLGEKFKIIDDIAKANDVNSIKKHLDVWTKVMRDLVLAKYAGQNLVSNSKIYPELSQLSGLYSKQKLLEIIKGVKSVKYYLDANVNPRLALENFILNF